MKKFKSKKHIKIKYKRIVIAVLIITISILILKKIGTLRLLKITPVKTLEYSNIYKRVNMKEEIKQLTTQILKIDINKPTTILKHMMLYETPYIKENEYHAQKQEQKKEPQIYIYNTHQKEKYVGNDIMPTPTVLDAAHYLKENLEKNGIPTLVEETNIEEILNNNNWNYNQSYKASRINLEKIKTQYPNIKIFIDLHRDSVNKNISTVTINDKNYAKVLFVIGKEHDNYKNNLEFTKSINDIIERDYSTLTRGILEKEGWGVNGIYNQDVATNVMLIEVGAEENTIDEVTNTLDIITNVIKEKINEK